MVQPPRCCEVRFKYHGFPVVDICLKVAKSFSLLLLQGLGRIEQLYTLQQPGGLSWRPLCVLAGGSRQPGCSPEGSPWGHLHAGGGIWAWQLPGQPHPLSRQVSFPNPLLRKAILDHSEVQSLLGR